MFGLNLKQMLNRLSRQIRDIYGKFDFDNTVIYCDKKVMQTHRFQYEVRNNNNYDNDDDDEEKKENEGYGIIRLEYSRSLHFDDVILMRQELMRRELSKEYIAQIVHILHRNTMREIGYIQFGRSHYIDPDNIKSLEIKKYPHLQRMHGFFSTIEPCTQKGTIICFRNKVRLKEKRTIYDIMDYNYHNCMNQSYQTEQEKMNNYENNVYNQIIGRYFITLHARRTIRKIDGIDFKKTLDDTFDYKGSQTSFRQYFWKVYNQELQQDFPGLIKVENRNGRIDYYPPELCYLTGYPKKLRDDKKITGIIARNTSIPLRERIDNFDKVIKKLNRFNAMNNRQRMVSGDPNVMGHTRTLQYGQDLLEIDGYRIAPVPILYNSISNGGMTIISDKQLLGKLKDMRPIGGNQDNNLHVVSWGIAYFEHRPLQQNSRPQTDYPVFERLSNIYKQFINEWWPNDNIKNDMDFVLSPYPRPLKIMSPRPDDMDIYLKNIIFTLKDYINEYKLEAIVFILPSIVSRDDVFTSEIYNVVKALCNVVTGTITQCIRAGTIIPENNNYGGGRGGRGRGGRGNNVYSILLSSFRQLMVKLGAIPWKLQLGIIDDDNDEQKDNPKLNYLPDNVLDLKIPTMIVGIDVNHNRNRGVSTIGFISTYEPDFVKIMAQVDYQRMGQEVVHIEKLQLLAENAITNFHEINGIYPQQIFVYRDGVSLGELDKVARKELNAIRRAAMIISVDFPRPNIEFMVVQKRVNARFFEQSYNGLIGANPPVIIDTDVVSTKFWDFYLIACGAPKDKVANPVRVIIVNDDLKLGDKNSKNDLELFTYALCNLYYGWGGSVKIPHVIKYADKIAEMYSNTYNYMDIVNGEINKPNVPSQINLTQHFL